MLHRFVVGIFVVCAGALLTPSTTYAHKLIVDAQIRPDAPTTLSIETHYDPDEPAEGVKITVQDGDGKMVAEGKSDAKGVCQLPRPTGGTYRIIADDGQGHRAEMSLEVPASEAEVVKVKSERRNPWLMSAVGISMIAVAVAGLRRRRKRLETA